MTQNDIHTRKRTRSRWRWLWIIPLILFLVAVLVRLSLKSAVVHTWVKNAIISSANENLNIRLDISELKGDLWKEMQLTGITLAGEDTVVSVDSLNIRYRLLSILGNRFEMKEVRITHPYLFLEQEQEKWNIMGWIKDTGGPSVIPGFAVHQLDVIEGEVRVESRSTGGDSLWAFREIQLNSELDYLDEQFNIAFKDLSFQLTGSGMRTPISVETMASASNDIITLEKLAVAVGASLLQASGQYQPSDSSIRLGATADPLSWETVTAYVAEYPVNSDIKMGLSVSGSPHNFDAELTVEAPGVQNAEMTAGFRWKDEIAMQRLSFSAAALDLNTLLQRQDFPVAKAIHFSVNGHFPFSEYRESNGRGTLTIGQARRGNLSIQSIGSTFELRRNRLDMTFNGSQREQRLKGDITINRLWDDHPGITASFSGSQIDPGYWAGDTYYAGNLTFNGKLAGRGWSWDGSAWQYEIQVNGNRIFGQDFDFASFAGTVSGQSATAKGILKVGNNEIRHEAEIKALHRIPEYTYHVSSRALNLGDFRHLEDFRSALSFSITGEGRGITPETLDLKSGVRIDSSAVNGEYIEKFTANIEIADTVVQFRETELVSSMANGQFSGQFHLKDWYRLSNNLNLDVQVEDISLLAPVLEMENLKAAGTVKGSVKPDVNRRMIFNGNVNLTDVGYGELFDSEQVTGNIEVTVSDSTDYSLNIHLTNPTFRAVRLQNFNLKTDGSYREEEAKGDFTILFQGSGNGRIEHSGEYRARTDSSVLRTNQFDLTSNQGRLGLAKPFTVHIHNQAISTDTLKLHSEKEARMELAIPYADSTSQQFYLMGSGLNLTVLQDIMLQDHYLGGILSGNLHVDRQDSILIASGDLDISEIMYRGASFERFSLNAQVENHLLKGTVSLEEGNKKIIEGHLSAPFKLQDPASMGEQFFNQPVEGTLSVNALDLNRFDQLLADAGIMETGGILNLKSTLSGQAGSPDLITKMNLSQARVSGVAIDSMVATLNYEHAESQFRLDGSIQSLTQKAAEISAVIPLFIDLKEFRISLPDKEDRITINLNTNDFNLAAVNDFINPDYIRQVAGRLNGSIQIQGVMGDLEASGSMQLTDGSVNVVPAGIRIQDVRSTMKFASEEIIVEEMIASSGNGNIRVNGTIGLEQLIPGALDLKVIAKNFRIANTTDYRANVNITSDVGGTLTRPGVNGSVEFINGFVYLRNFGDRSVEYIELDTLERTGPEISLYDSLSMEMDVSFNRRFYVRNTRYLEMEVELEGQVELLKESGKELQAYGTLSAAGGYATPLGKRFTLEEGVLTFSGAPANPGLNIQTLYKPPQPKEDISIWYHIEGTVEKPLFRYDSSPPMELENIISYTLFGQPFYALDSWKQVLASSGSNNTAGDVALDVLMDRVESIATRKLGIDVVRIDNTRVGSERGTAITTGWYISPRIFFAMQNVISSSTSDTGFLLEYKLRRNLKLIISQGNDSRQGIDLKWEHEY